MSYEEEFDRIMRQKAEEMEYPFEEAHWEKAGEMISRSRGGGKEVVRSLIWSAAVITAGGLLTLMWFGTGEKSTQLATAKPAAAMADVRTPAPLGSTAGPENTAPQSAPAIPAPQELGGSGDAPVQAAVEDNTDVQTPSGDNHDKRPAGDLPDEQPAVGVTTAVKTNISWHQEQPAQASAQPQITPATGEKQEEADEPAVVSGDEGFQFLVGTQGGLDYSQSEIEPRLNTIVAVKGDDDYVARPRMGRRFFVDLEAGGAFWTGWQAEGTYNGRGINWFGGANAGFFAGRRWNFSTGVQAFSFAHLEAPFYEASAKTYGFSSVTSNTVIVTRELRYVGIPIRAGYTFPGGAQLRAGLIGAQLWYAKSDIVTSTERNEEITQTSSRVSRSIYDGMNQQLLMVTAGYGIRLSEKFSAGVDVVYGVTDLFSSRTYLQRSERPLVIRAGLTFRILDRR